MLINFVSQKRIYQLRSQYRYKICKEYKPEAHTHNSTLNCLNWLLFSSCETTAVIRSIFPPNNKMFETITIYCNWFTGCYTPECFKKALSRLSNYRRNLP